MISFLKIAFSVYAVMMLDINSRRDYFNSISPEWDLFIVKYNKSSIKYISRPLHYDAITHYIDIVNNAEPRSAMDVHNIIASIRCWDDRICDIMLHKYNSTEYFAPRHLVYGKPIIPTHRQYEFVKKFSYIIDYIHNPSDEIIEYHKFVNEL